MEADAVFQRPGAAVHAAAQLLACQLGEPALDLVDPRGIGRGEVQVEARSLQEPALD